MEFRKVDLDGRLADIYDSGTESRLAILFVNGPFNAELWRHQIRYFSKDYRVLAYRNGDGLEEELELVERLLDSMDLQNVVLAASGPGTMVANLAERRPEVAATLLSQVPDSLDSLNMVYRLAGGGWLKKPKVLKWLFMSQNTDYSIARKLAADIEFPPPGDLEDYTGRDVLERPEKDSIYIHPGSCRFTSWESAEKLRSRADIVLMEDAGTFPQYERPGEFNEIMHVFLEAIEESVRTRALRERRSRNSTLEDFIEDRGSTAVERRMVTGG